MAKRSIKRQRRAPPPAPRAGFIAFGLMLAAAAFLMFTSDDEKVAEAAAGSTSRFSCSVAYVNDGDTLRCADGTSVRLHAVAARESDGSCSPGHPCPAGSAASAKAELERLVIGSTITCSRTGRSYNRVTAICWTTDEVEVNCAMVRSGKTVVWERFDRERRICAGSRL